MLPTRRTAAAIIAASTLLAGLSARAVTFNNQTISGTVLLPASDFSQAHSFIGTITLDNATVDNEGYLRNEQTPVIVQGNGLINIRGPMGIWTNGWVSSHLTIRPGVEVNGYHGTSFNADGISEGIIAAVPGGSGGIWGSYFHMGLDRFTNDGLIEVRSGATMTMYLMDGLFENDGTLRVQAGGTLDLSVEQGSPLTPAALGAVENNGLIKLNQFRMSGHGVFELTGAGTWDFQRYTHIVDSTLNIPATAIARIVSTSSPAALFQGVKINGVMNSVAQSEATISGGLQLNGQWRTATGSELFFQGPQTVSGVGQFIADGNTIFRASVGTTTFGPDVDLVVPSTGSLSLTHFSTPLANPYVLQGDVDVTGGSFGTSSGVTENYGDIHAESGGSVSFSGTLNNHGTVRVDSGATLRLNGTFTNNGSTTVDHGILRLDSFPQGNAISITDSTIQAAVFNQTLAQLQVFPRTRSEIVAAATVNLEGQTLTIADQDNQRWATGAGGYQNGTLNSADGFELITRASGGVLRNLELNADARVTAGNTLQINANVTGSGDLIVDGGTLQFGGYGNAGEPMTSDVVARVVPRVGVAGSKVLITGPMDNAGRTVYLKSGAAWELNVIRSKGIIGGRIEGDPGVELIIRGYGGSPPTYGDLNGITLATNARLSSSTIGIVDGLTLDGGVLAIGNPANQESSSASAIFYGDSTISGAGEIRFESAPPGQSSLYARSLRTSSPTARLTIAPGVTVRTSSGNGAFFFGNQLPGALTNEGRLLAENGHTFTVITGDFVQRGTLRATSNATLAVVDSSLTNEGRLEASGGRITFTGDLIQSPAATMSIVLAPQPPTALPSIQSAGSIALDGKLELNIVPEYAPIAGNSFKLIEATGGITGAFDVINLPSLTGNLYWSFDAQPTTLNLTVASGAPSGDYTDDGQADGADFLAWQRGRSATPLSAGDLNTWRTNFGASAATAALTSVPEPRALTLLIPLGALSNRAARRMRRAARRS